MSQNSTPTCKVQFNSNTLFSFDDRFNFLPIYLPLYQSPMNISLTIKRA